MANHRKKGHKAIQSDTGKLASVLDKSAKAQEYVAEAAANLADVNEALADQSIQTAHSDATVMLNKRAEENVVCAAEELAVVNQELEIEVAARRELQAALADAKASEREAWHRSLHDSGTGLPNRDLFLERLHHGLAQARRHGWKLGLLCIDLDRFKTANDTHGHDIGDKVLYAVGQRLQSSVRAEDTVSRVGGDEFMCILLDVKSAADAAEVAAKIMARIAEPYDFDGIAPQIGSSVGIAMYPEHGDTPDALLKYADAAMYHAKRNTPPMNRRVSRGAETTPD